MKIMKTTTEELHSFLILVSTVLKKESRTSMTTLRSLHNIPVVILDHLVSEGVISSTGKGRGVAWKWTGEVVPSREIAELLLLQVGKAKGRRAAERKKQILKKGEKIAATFLEKSRSNADVQFDNMLAGIDPFTVESEPVFKSHKLPQPVYDAVDIEATTKEALEPLKKKSYGITKLLWGRIVLRTNYYE
jgi:hypothetical protein